MNKSLIISDRIISIRKNAGLSQQEFADVLMVGKPLVAHWETNRNYPKLENLITICEKFNVSSDYILFGDEKFNKTKTSPNSKEKEDGKKIQVDADVVISLLEVIRDDQKEILANFGRIQDVSSLSSTMREDGLDSSDVEALIAKERARIAAGERGARNVPVKRKVSDKK